MATQRPATRPRILSRRGIPTAGDNFPSVLAAIQAIQEQVEGLSRQRGSDSESSARVSELSEAERRLDESKANTSHEQETTTVTGLEERLQRIEHALWGHPDIEKDFGIMGVLRGEKHGEVYGDREDKTWQDPALVGYEGELGLLGIIYGSIFNEDDKGWFPWKCLLATEDLLTGDVVEEEFELSFNQLMHVVMGPEVNPEYGLVIDDPTGARPQIDRGHEIRIEDLEALATELIGAVLSDGTPLLPGIAANAPP